MADIHNTLDALSAWLARRPEALWLVGGGVRDTLLGQQSNDIDLAVAGDALNLARKFATALSGNVAILDQTDGIARVRFPDLPWHFDFVALRGDTIENDLAARDFTANAIAIPFTPAHLAALVATDGASLASQAIDPFGGRDDLAKRQLQLVSDDALADDPLRILRAARLAARLDLTFDADLIARARAIAPRLDAIAPERITGELFAICARPSAMRALRLLDELGALTVLVPPLEACRGMKQGDLHYWDVLTHTCAVLDSHDRMVALLECGLNEPERFHPVDQNGRVPHPNAVVIGSHNTTLLAHLHETYAEGQSRLTLLKFAAIFHDIAKPLTRVVTEGGKVRFPNHAEAGVPLTQPILQRWKLGRQARRFIEAVVACHMRPGAITAEGINDRALRLYFRDAGDAAIDVALFSIADHLAVYGPTLLTGFWERQRAVLDAIICRFYEEPERVVPSRFIQGRDLLERYPLISGPTIGHLLSQVHTDYLEGMIDTREEAFALVDRLVKGATDETERDSADRL